ncbi:MAG: hypothetical protein ACYC35_21125 [Pirellulales bacterium]|jgi:hypothetical protein
MTSRERWTVYPLLFLALGISLKTKVSPTLKVPFVECEYLEVTHQLHAPLARCNQLSAAQLECQDLAVLGSGGKNRVRMGTGTNGTGRIEVYGKKDKAIVAIGSDDAGRTGAVDTMTSEGVPQVSIRSSEIGGTVTTADTKSRKLVELRHDEKGSGYVFTFDVNRVPHVLLGPAIRLLEPKQKVESPKTKDESKKEG